MDCPKCGSKVREGVVFCLNCGQRLISEEELKAAEDQAAAEEKKAEEMSPANAGSGEEDKEYQQEVNGKEEKKVQREAAKEAKKARREAAREAKKARREAAREAKKAQREAAKEAKKVQREAAEEKKNIQNGEKQGEAEAATEIREPEKAEEQSHPEREPDTELSVETGEEGKGIGEESKPRKILSEETSRKIALCLTMAALLCVAVAGGIIYYFQTPGYKYEECIRLGDAMIAQGEYLPAIEKYQKSTEYKEMDVITEKAIYLAYVAMAKESLLEGKEEEALGHLENARKYTRDKTEVDGIERALYLEKAENAAEEKAYEEAILYYDKAKELGEKSEVIIEKKKMLYQVWGEDAFAKEDYTQAVNSFEKAYELGGSYDNICKAYAKYYLVLSRNFLLEDKLEEATENIAKGYEYVASDEDRESYEEMTRAVTERRRELQVQSLGFEVKTDENGEVYDLGGIRVVLCDWWSTEDSGTEESEYYKLRKEYLMWLQDTYHFTLREEKKYEWADAFSDFSVFSQENSDEYRLYTLYDSPQLAALVKEGKLYDLSALDCLDFTKEKFTQNGVCQVYTNAKGTFGMSGDAPMPRNGLYFNKRILEEAGVSPEDLYEWQRTNQWTWEKWIWVMEQVESNTDKAGVTPNIHHLADGAVFSNGGSYVDRVDGKYVYALEKEQTRTALSFAMEVYQSHAWRNPSSGESVDSKNAFHRAEAAFLVEDGYLAKEFLYDMEDEFGYICFPMGPDREEYQCCYANNVVVIPAKYSQEEAWKLAFIWDLYTEKLPGYEQDYKESFGFRDQESKEETLAIMGSHGTVAYDVMIPEISRKENLTRYLYDGGKLSKILRKVDDLWKDAIDKANG